MHVQDVELNTSTDIQAHRARDMNKEKGKDAEKETCKKRSHMNNRSPVNRIDDKNDLANQRI